MKQLIFGMLLFLFTGSVMAQNDDNKWAAGIGAGGYLNLYTATPGFMPELYFSRYVSPSFDVMVKQEFGFFNTGTNNNFDLSNVFLNVRYKLNNGKLFPDSIKIKPYIFGGVGYLLDNEVSGLNYDGGVGFKFGGSERYCFYAEAGFNKGIEAVVDNVMQTDNFIKATVGVEFNLGKAKDADFDGVADRKDQCPETPAGVTVDEKGCPLDIDLDGVADYLDDCPSVAGSVALKGCPDKDGDGIADKDDACPDVAGLKKLKGCPDSDEDGVADKDDKCPYTKRGWNVDASGCPVDSDKDGIVDAEDACPTVAGVPEERGCPAVKKEVVKDLFEGAIPVPVAINEKVIPVYFVLDKSYLTDYSKNKLNKLIHTLKINQDYLLELYGYTDNTASAEYNMVLSQKRIDTVIEYLTKNGINKSRIRESKAFGKSKPAADNNTDRGRQLNRRVEFKLLQMKK